MEIPFTVRNCHTIEIHYIDHLNNQKFDNKKDTLTVFKVQYTVVCQLSGKVHVHLVYISVKEFYLTLSSIALRSTFTFTP